ncbi:ribonuclease HI [Capnocytophaga sp. ARDL2]|uniref:ribonuclease HI n=1 Tax=Capnocytophaga sp. ARDL2 TaxID=3238809 RepID=UPI003558FE3C
MPQIIIHTDGSSRGNPGPGGFGVVLQQVGTQRQKEIAQGYRYTTNNRMELLAVIVGLEALKIENCDVLVVSDSKYVVDAINQHWIVGWQKKGFKGVKNPDLWQRFLQVYRKHKVQFQWIKGHNNHPLNERCDFLAVNASKQENLLIDEGYEQQNLFDI